mgnify:CR=1 FL=1
MSTRTRFYWKEVFSGFGGLVFIFVLLLLGIGLFYIYSASYYPPKQIYLPYAKRQMVWAAIAILPFLFVIYIDYNILTRYSLLIYGFGLFLLLLTLLIGTYRGGAKRWIKIGPLLLQTSEIMKIAIIPILAHILTTVRQKGKFEDLFLPLGITVIPMFLIMMQPDLGTSLVFIPIVFSMIFAAGIKVKHLVVLVLLMANLAVFTYFYGMHEYQRKRVKMFIFQDNMTLEQQRDAGYHLTQSKIAHGNGGLWGKGWQRGTQNRHGFLPERHTDFIFAVIGEEGGLIGTGFVLLLYFVLLISMLLVAYNSLLPNGQLIVVGVVEIGRASCRERV